MDIVISNTSDSPIYQQIYEQISAQIINGELPGDSCLPPIRTVAKELRISVIPVKMAWEELERRDFIYAMVGRGCFVSPLPSKDLNEKRNKLAYEKFEKEMEYYKALGFSMDEVIEMVRRFYGGDPQEDAGK
jgi:GntR family transcriptional regulator